MSLLLLTFLAFAGDDDDDDDAPVKYRVPTTIDFEAVAPAPSMRMAAEMGVTAGGAQDIGYFRDQIAAGYIPHPNVFTPEGLFGEHDLPITGTTRCTALICPIGEATQASLLAQPEVQWLAQLGFDSGIDAATWHRAPVNLVAVVDKSGSMSGEPIDAVKDSLLAVLGNLSPGDQVSIVTYGADVTTHLPPTSVSERGVIERAIHSIAINGSTNMEAGLSQGFALAKQSGAHFDGVSRVMLFTDERPNTGRTDAGSFMGMAIDASKAGVGMTTIGVGEQFGAELATQIASVRGGNLFFFPDALKMRDTFATELDTMISELAYDMELVVRPAPGLKIAGVYGIPGDAVSWTGDGALKMTVSTLFLSHEEGAIYFGFAPAGNLPPRATGTMGSVDVAYTLRNGERPHRSVDLVVTGRPQPGLARGLALVDEVTVLKAATALHHEKNDQEGAYQLVHALAGRWAGDTDPELQIERDLVAKVEARLAKLSGHQGEAPPLLSGRDIVNGLPRFGGATLQ